MSTLTPATTYAFITQPYRWSETYDQAVRAQYQLARTVEIEGKLTNLSDADAVGQALLDILKAPRLRFEVLVASVNILNLSMFDGQAPCATLINARFGLNAGRLVLVPDFTLDLDAGQTTLRCWG